MCVLTNNNNDFLCCSGFTFISAAMFIMAYGGMVGYLMIIKENLSYLLGVDAHDTMMQNAVLVLSSLTILLPISMQRVRENRKPLPPYSL
jgi:amino acid permease